MKICSILLYSYEIWDTKQFETIERIQYYACNRFMDVSQRASNAVLGDCGRYRLYIVTWKKVMKYWLKILRMTSDRYGRKCYDILLHFDTLRYKKWASEVRNILYVKCFMYVWEDQGVQNEITFVRPFEQRIKDQSLQTWKTEISSGNKLAFYSSFEFQHCSENYLNILKISTFRNVPTSLRVSCLH